MYRLLESAANTVAIILRWVRSIFIVGVPISNKVETLLMAMINLLLFYLPIRLVACASSLIGSARASRQNQLNLITCGNFSCEQLSSRLARGPMSLLMLSKMLDYFVRNDQRLA